MVHDIDLPYAQWQDRLLHVGTERAIAVWLIRHEVVRALHSAFWDRGFVQISAPMLADGLSVCNDADLSIPVELGDRRFLLSQTIRPYKEAVVPYLGRVYALGSSFRNENGVDRLIEFTHLEAEWLTESEDVVMKMEEEILEQIRSHVLRCCFKQLRTLDVDIDALKSWTTPFDRVSYSSACDDLNCARLGKREELRLADLRGGPVFVTKFPASEKGSYAKLRTDNTVEAHDLIVPTVGELLGGAMRESTAEGIRRRLVEEGVIDSVEYHPYVLMRTGRDTKHGGFGVGVERLLLWLLGMSDISDLVPFPVVI